MTMQRQLFILSTLVCGALTGFALAGSAQTMAGWGSDANGWDGNAPMPNVGYDVEAASKWARYYTREDLEPVPYMESSASMVMRPRNPDDDIFGTGSKVGEPRGYAAIERRDHLNTLNGDRPKMYLGEPGTNPYGMFQPDGSGGLGTKTAIGRPKQNWRGEPANPFGKQSAAIAPRPGDFDYKPPTRLGAKDESGMVYETTPGGGNGGQQIFDGNQPRYTGGGNTAQGSGNPMDYAYNPQGQGGNGGAGYNNGGYGSDGSGNYDGNRPDRYRVRRGDSLSGISDQEKIYGDWKLWPLIYDANRNQINDPDLIHPGQDLGIPRDYGQPEEVDARRRAMDKTAPYDFYDGR